MKDTVRKWLLENNYHFDPYMAELVVDKLTCAYREMYIRTHAEISLLQYLAGVQYAAFMA